MTPEQQHRADKILSALAFEKNEIFDAVLELVDESITGETARAVSVGIDENKRAHACGRADALLDLKDLLLNTQVEARNRFPAKKQP
jgi:hypothetical protein